MYMVKDLFFRSYAMFYCSCVLMIIYGKLVQDKSPAILQRGAHGVGPGQPDDWWRGVSQEVGGLLVLLGSGVL